MYMFRSICFVLLALLALTAPAFAQKPATSKSVFAWEVDDTTNVPDAATAQALTATVYVDGSSAGVVLQGVTCAVSKVPTVFSCQAPVIAFTAGDHTLQLSLSNEAGESAKAPTPAYSFRFQVKPKDPVAPRIESR